jgi:hypothetical protein
MPNALTPLANITLGSAASSVTFSGISGAYRDLMLVAKLSATSNTGTTYIEFNATANFCASVNMAGTGSSVYSNNNSGPDAQALIGQWTGTNSSSLNHAITLNFMDYAATDKHKGVLYRNMASAAGAESGFIRFASTSALTSFRLFLTSSTFIAGSSFALYGVSA